MVTIPVPAPRGAPPRARKGHDKRTGRLGQSLAEFALTVPLALLMILFGLDFGRVFLGWVSLNQAAREAANYAAMNPSAWSLPYNLAVQAEYARLVTTEVAEINCTLVTPVPDPTFPDGTGVGAPALVDLDCRFDLITPVIGMLTGNPIPVSASSAFPIRSGNIEGVPAVSALPTVTPDPSATPSPTPTPDPAATPTPTPDPAATPTPTPDPTPQTCTVVSLLNVLANKAQSDWRDAGFGGTVIFVPLVPPNYKIQWQSETVGDSILCTSGITVRSHAP